MDIIETVDQPMHSRVFTNPDINLENVPRVSEVNWRAVSPRLVVRNSIRNAFTWSIFVLLFIGLLVLGWLPTKIVFLNPIGLTLFSATLVFIVICVTWPIFEVPRRGFVLREHDFLYKEGILYVRTFSIPFARIQHAETTVNVFDRLVNLGALKLYTAGGQSVFLGFEKDYAHDLRTHILERVRELDHDMVDDEELTTLEER